MHILLVVLRNEKIHALLIKDEATVQKLTGLRICPKCNQVVNKYHKFNGDRYYNKHVEACTGEFKAKFKPAKKSKTFVPHILKNKQYFEKLANNKQYIPTYYYVTYDFETMMKPVHKESGKSLTYAEVIPLSLASHFKSPTGPIRDYLDIRTPNFIYQWIDKMFEYAFTYRDMNPNHLNTLTIIELSCIQ